MLFRDSLTPFAPAASSPIVTEITVQQVHEKITQGRRGEFRLIDVRSVDQYEEMHIPDTEHKAKNLITHAINTNNLKKTEEIILLCQSGEQSYLVAAVLIKSGFKNVKLMTGGIDQWIKAGFEIKKRSDVQLSLTA